MQYLGYKNIKQFCIVSTVSSIFQGLFSEMLREDCRIHKVYITAVCPNFSVHTFQLHSLRLYIPLTCLADTNVIAGE
jgi:hypothetical protein